MKFKRRRLSEEEKRRVVVGHEKSGDTLRESAKKAGIGMSTLSLWRRQYSQAGGDRLVEVNVVSGEVTGGSGNYRVTLPGGVSLEFHRGFEICELRSVLEALKEPR